ncbi:MAG: 2-C-methyl-D-erythritol 2,4-cyclodiphosphate synthase, partial [Cyclobacteriaceae bacterium]|nr:2-C-methyl-D-erythritol 2,4-cyclodiphosphate synthase [Cyclobacteriaceae bacterium]
KINPHVSEMCKTLAEVMVIDIDNISIKATTTEKLGFVGTEAGVAAFANVLIIKEGL